MIPCKLVHYGFKMFDGAMLLSRQDCMSASVNRLLTIILFNLLAVFFLFICYCSLFHVLPHVFPIDWSWYSALNLIARHAITAENPSAGVSSLV